MDNNLEEVLSKEEILKRHKIGAIKNILENEGILDPYGKNPNPFNREPYSTQYVSIAITSMSKKDLDEKNMSYEEAFQKYNEGDSEFKKGWSTYTTYLERMKFFKMLLENQVILVIAGTGVGKSVIIPKLLTHYLGYESKQKVIMSIPTRASVITTAKWAAICMDVELGKQVGYHIGDSGGKLIMPWTKLIYATQQKVIDEVNKDPLLLKYGGVIIDEAHVREYDTDMLIALVGEVAIKRPEFKIIIMSATMDKKPFEAYFKRKNLSYELYEVEGKKSQYEVKSVFSPKEYKMDEIFNNNAIEKSKIVQKIEELLMKNETSTILAFVATKPQTKNIRNYIEKNKSKYPNKPWAFALTGGKLSDKEDYELENYAKGTEWPPGDYKRKVIIATNAVEFSVSFAGGLGYVIESGLEFGVYRDPVRYATIMETRWIAKSNIGQRCGRTGRKMPGQCIRMYTEEQYNKFREFKTDAILERDITNDILSLMNVANKSLIDVYKFMTEMVTPPSKDALIVAIRNLNKNNLINMQNYYLTPLGRLANRIFITSCKKFHRFKMIVAGYYLGCLKDMVFLTAILNTDRINYDKMFIDDKKLDTKDKSYVKKNKDKLKIKFGKYGEFIVLLDIYKNTRTPMYYAEKKDKDGKIQNTKASARKSYFKYYSLNEKTINDIDKNVTEIWEVVIKNIYEIDQLKLFEVENSQLRKQFHIDLQSGGLQSNEKNTYKLTKKCINTKIGGAIKSKKLKKTDNRVRAKKILDAIHIQLDTERPMKITKFKNHINNLLFCIFFGYHTNIAHYIGSDSKDKRYLVKHINQDEKYQTTKPDRSSIIVGRPSIIVYDEFTISGFGSSFNLMCNIPRIIIKKFGIVLPRE